MSINIIIVKLASSPQHKCWKVSRLTITSEIRVGRGGGSSSYPLDPSSEIVENISVQAVDYLCARRHKWQKQIHIRSVCPFYLPGTSPQTAAFLTAGEPSSRVGPRCLTFSVSLPVVQGNCRMKQGKGVLFQSPFTTGRAYPGAILTRTPHR